MSLIALWVMRVLKDIITHTRRWPFELILAILPLKSGPILLQLWPRRRANLLKRLPERIRLRRPISRK